MSSAPLGAGTNDVVENRPRASSHGLSTSRFPTPITDRRHPESSTQVRIADAGLKPIYFNTLLLVVSGPQVVILLRMNKLQALVVETIGGDVSLDYSSQIGLKLLIFQSRSPRGSYALRSIP